MAQTSGEGWTDEQTHAVMTESAGLQNSRQQRRPRCPCQLVKTDAKCVSQSAVFL